MKPSYRIQPEATESAFGGLATDAAVYHPLDVVTVHITEREQGDTLCTIRVCDPEQRPYVERTVMLEKGHGNVQFHAGGALGTQYVYLIWPGDTKHSRFITFCLDCETKIQTGDATFDDLFPITHAGIIRGRREYETPAGRFVGYMSADTWHFDGIWLRDWIYGIPAYKYWERDMVCGLDRFFEQQDAKGMIPDGIERNGNTWRVGLESDVEYIMTLGVWQTWQTTGDDQWLASMLPKLEQALAYIQRDEKHWDTASGLVKRQHSCDTWDFDIDGISDRGDGRFVVATCDQSGYVKAFEAMSHMYAHLGKDVEAKAWEKKAQSYRQRANELLWDGEKYLHHAHIDAIDHGSFDETTQLAMGNTWAMTRGLASPAQSRSIIDEYKRRHEETGDAYPWWSLQAGYPDELGYFNSRPFCHQGGYANGGLMPWVGGELCRAAFLFGREAYGVELMRAYVELLKIRGGVHLWYWPNGEAGFRTTNEVPYPAWGMAEWVEALIEGLAGIHDKGGQLRHLIVSPRWAVSGIDDAQVRIRYAASKFYCAYTMNINRDAKTLAITYTGSGEQTAFRLLLPETWQPVSVAKNSESLPFTIEAEDTSRYVCFGAPVSGILSIMIQCQTDH